MFGQKSKNPKIQKSKNPKILESKNPEIQKSKNPKIQKSWNPKILKSRNPKILKSKKGGLPHTQKSTIHQTSPNPAKSYTWNDTGHSEMQHPDTHQGADSNVPAEGHPGAAENNQCSRSANKMLSAVTKSRSTGTQRAMDSASLRAAKTVITETTHGQSHEGTPARRLN